MLNIFYRFPFIRILLFFILGIVFQYYRDISSYFIYISILSILFIALSFFSFIYKRYEWRFLFGLGLFLFLFSSAAFTTKQAWTKSVWNIDSAMYLYEGRIVDELARKPKTYLCKVEIVSAEKSIAQEVISKKIIIYLPIDSLSKSLVPGDYLTFYASLKPSELYLKKQSIAAIGFVQKNKWALDENKKRYSSLKLRALATRRTLLDHLSEIIPKQENFSLAAALMFGYKNEMDRDMRQAFANIGAGHILAVSGLHFSIIFGMICSSVSFLGRTPRSRLMKQIFLLPLIWGFAFLTGLSPSVIRAATMLSLWGVGDAFFRKSFTLNTIGVTAFSMLLYNPLYLFDVGFQLSFTAVLSIVLVNPYLVRLYETRNPLIKYLWDLCCVSISAQIGVLPISIYYFNQLPLLFLLTNLCVIPLTNILLLLIPLSVFLVSLFGNIPILFWPLNKTLDFFVWIVKSLDDISFGTLNSIQINLEELIFLFLVLFCILLFLLKKRIVYFYLLLILAAFQVFYYLCQS